MFVMFWHQSIGMGAINMYSNKLLENMQGSGAWLTPRQGTYLIGIVNFISSAAGVLTSKSFTRRFLLIYGHFVMGLANIGVGLCAFYDYPNAVLAFILTFVIFFQSTSGCITWPYITEVTVDAALGTIGFSGYLTVFILSFTN